MKRIVKYALVVFALALIPFAMDKSSTSIQVSASEASMIYVSSSGSDENNGSEQTPYQTLEAALSNAENGSTIILKDTVVVNGWTEHDKAVTISGGVLDASASDRMIINDDVTFTNITIKASEIYANGNTVVMGENVTTSGSGVCLYGGGEEGSTLDSTNLTVLSGTYGYIFGGSHGESGNVATIMHDTNLTIGGTTQAQFVFGGANGSSDIYGTSYFKITGGMFEGAYGGNQLTNAGNDVDFEITGGTFEQVFGASSQAYLTGTVNFRLLGGTVTRRVYGGCYNETSGRNFKTSCYVNGKINLSIAGDVNIALSSSEGDTSIYARTRHKTEVETEQTVLTFLDETAYNKYKDKLGAQDLTMQVIMGSLTPADIMHYYYCESDGATLMQKCAYCEDFSASITMQLDENVSLRYNGEAIEPVIVSNDGNWVGEMPQVVYKNNVEAGKAICSITAGQVSAELDFIIVDAPVVLGGSVRLSNPSGLRFQSIVPAGLKDSGAVFGTLIIPKAVLGDNELTHATPMVEDIQQTQWATETVKATYPQDYLEGYEYFNAVMTGIPEEHFDTELVARSYVYANGQYYYAEELDRSIAQVAAFALKDGYTDEILYDYVDKAVEEAPLTMESEVQLWEEQTAYQLTLEGNLKGYAVIWTSSNEEIVSVDENGYITAGKTQGRVTITAKLGSQVVQCTVVSMRRWSNYY